MRLLSQRWRSDGSLKVCCYYCLVDIILAISVGFLCGLLFIGFVPPYKRGFYCDDTSIRLPYKPNTVSIRHLLTLSILVPILLVIWYQIWTFLISPSSRRDISPIDSSVACKNCASLADRTRICFAFGTSVCVEYFFGLMVVSALVLFGKSAFGVLRPHFIDACRPNASLVACGYRGSIDLSMMDNADDLKKISIEDTIYIEDAYCTTNDYYKLKIARESFPSGHAAVAVFASFFILSFMRDRSRRSTAISPFGRSASSFCPPLLRYAFSLICISWTCFVCASRIWDYWHHWTDVVGGIGLGLAVGCVLFYRKDSAFRNSSNQCKVVDY